ncbi:MAG: hypothetical protein DMG06_12790 [Acidobacteria bacterium]|nr:MAG: hypothetical protein DMG06_12790 [Acidobacteriota bacterium]
MIESDALGASLAAFMELRGRRIVEACGTLWHSVDGGFFMSIPYQLSLDPEPGPLEHMLRSVPAMGVRFPSRTWLGLPSGVYLYRKKQYDLKCVHPKHRRRVIRGLERFQIREIEPGELLAQGLQLNRDTMARQGRYDPEFGEERQWKRVVDATYQCPAVVPFGAFAGGRLGGCMITCCDSRCLHILYQASRQEDLKDFPNHALTFSVTRRAAENPELDSVCYGCLSLVRTTGLHEYKLRFGYELIPHNSVIWLHPRLAPLLSSQVSLQLVRRLRGLCPRNQRLEQTEAVLRGARLSKHPPTSSDLRPPREVVLSRPPHPLTPSPPVGGEGEHKFD